MTMLAEAVEIARERTNAALLNKPLLSIRGRPIIFTPERIDQIRNLRERGKTPEEIAEIIGCTIGTLRVKCSHLGISLRVAVPKNVMMLPKPKNMTLKTNGDNGAKFLSLPPITFPDGFSLQFSYRGQNRMTPINISNQTITTLVLEAEIRGISISEMFALLIEKVLERNLVDELLSPLPSSSE
jgi:hypothetical protein